MAFPSLRPALRAFSCGVLLHVAGCDQWHLSINSDGLVFISIIGEDDQPRDRFRVRTRRSDGSVQMLDVPASGRLTLTSLTDGPLELTLLAPDGCRVNGPNPRTVNASAGEEIRVAFDVRCSD